MLNNTYILEGTGVPALKYADGTEHQLPEPNGENKEGTRKYKFTKQVRESWLSEDGTIIEVGVSYIFEASLSWVKISKEHMDKLFKAQNDNIITVWLNADKETLKFDMRVSDLDYSFPKGNINHPAGYSAAIKLITVKNLSQAGYEQLVSETGYGDDYGSQGGSGY